MGCLQIHSSRIGCGIHLSSIKIGDSFKVESRKVTNVFNVESKLVCIVNKDAKIILDKKYLFLTPYNNFSDYINIVSNIVWNVQ